MSMGKVFINNKPDANSLGGVLPLGKGGTNSNNTDNAAEQLSALDLDRRNAADGVVGLNEQRVIYNELFTDETWNTAVSIDGPVSVVVGSSNTYTIGRYSNFNTYDVSVNTGTVNRVNETITFIAPATPQTAIITLNGRQFSIHVTPITDHVNTPNITSPVTGASGLGPDVTFTSSAFNVSSGSDTHEGTDWQIATDANFTGILSSLVNNATNKTSWTITGLLAGGTYYIRARYKGTTLGYSNYSPVVSFTTKASYIPSAEEAILLASDKAASDLFGCSIAMSTDGSRVAVGAMDADAVIGSNANNGKAYVFVRSGTTWTQEAIILPNVPQTNSGFGRSVSISGQGDRIVIGAPSGTSGDVVPTGLAYVFKRIGSTWTQETILIASDATASDAFGLPVAISTNGDRIAIGASAANYSGALDAGKVYMFTRSGSTWTQETILTASNFVANASFGITLTINTECDKVVIGTYSGNTSSPVNVYTFTRSGTTWTQIAINQIPFTLTISSVNVTMSRDGSRLVAGNYGPFINIGGAVIVYKWVTNTWVQETILNIPTGVSGDSFGYSVSISDDGSKIAIGAIGEDPSGISSAGRVYIFTRSGTAWSQAKAFAASDMNVDDSIGGSISISGDGTRMATGAFYADPSGLYRAGKAYIFA